MQNKEILAKRKYVHPKHRDNPDPHLYANAYVNVPFYDPVS